MVAQPANPHDCASLASTLDAASEIAQPPGDIKLHTCDVCHSARAESKCRKCNFCFCHRDRAFVHLCSCEAAHAALVSSFDPMFLTIQHQRRRTVAGIGCWLVRNTVTSYVWVDALTPGGPAERSGQLCLGDVVLAIDSVKVSYLPSLARAIEGPPGTSVELTVLRRDGGERLVRVVRSRDHAPSHSAGFETTVETVCVDGRGRRHGLSNAVDVPRQVAVDMAALEDVPLTRHHPAVPAPVVRPDDVIFT